MQIFHRGAPMHTRKKGPFSSALEKYYVEVSIPNLESSDDKKNRHHLKKKFKATIS